MKLFVFLKVLKTIIIANKVTLIGICITSSIILGSVATMTFGNWTEFYSLYNKISKLALQIKQLRENIENLNTDLHTCMSKQESNKSASEENAMEVDVASQKLIAEVNKTELGKNVVINTPSIETGRYNEPGLLFDDLSFLTTKTIMQYVSTDGQWSARSVIALRRQYNLLANEYDELLIQQSNITNNLDTCNKLIDPLPAQLKADNQDYSKAKHSFLTMFLAPIMGAIGFILAAVATYFFEDEELTAEKAKNDKPKLTQGTNK